MKSLLVAIVAGVLVAGAGCSRDKDRDDRKADYPGYDRPGEQHKTSRYTDPVCGVAGSDQFMWTYNGKDYYFHSDECRRKFQENPSAYAGGQSTPDVR